MNMAFKSLEDEILDNKKQAEYDKAVKEYEEHENQNRCNAVRCNNDCLRSTGNHRIRISELFCSHCQLAGLL